jgi:predicted NBD/HSP70 family sugar kinase
LVTEATGLPTAVGNDVQALTSAEHWFGAGAGLRSMVLITVGAGDGSPTYDEAVERVRSGDAAARLVFDEAGYALGVLIGHAANFLDPQRILLTGDGLPLYEVSEPRVHDGIKATYEEDPALIDLAVLPFDYVDAFFSFYSEGKLDEATVFPTVKEVTGRAPTTFAEWTRTNTGRFQ